uniref:Uncharacterized protein n=1 Tax=Tanacetum cinerariifolium TaxID=118510 RepID=A0A6L2L2L8_TANCI|nr:hypothetical protein [Tanacetum cinerariifolium]
MRGLLMVGGGQCNREERCSHEANWKDGIGDHRWQEKGPVVGSGGLTKFIERTTLGIVDDGWWKMTGNPTTAHGGEMLLGTVRQGKNATHAVEMMSLTNITRISVILRCWKEVPRDLRS